MKYGFVIDNRKCIGCHACTTACKSEHQVPVGVNRTWVKYTEKGKVLIGVRNRGQALELCVLDTGPGLTETEQRTFLKAYEKGSTSSGHGLGLSVCHDLAREHGLAFTCQSVKGRGTQFSLSLPASS